MNSVSPLFCTPLNNKIPVLKAFKFNTDIRPARLEVENQPVARCGLKKVGFTKKAKNTG